MDYIIIGGGAVFCNILLKFLLSNVSKTMLFQVLFIPYNVTVLQVGTIVGSITKNKTQIGG